ncbi:hypothetical protein [Granulosicoccus antarcticus]|nr:hypothetical protein [Granulosicoccus antarcticus]
MDRLTEQLGDDISISVSALQAGDVTVMRFFILGLVTTSMAEKSFWS